MEEPTLPTLMPDGTPLQAELKTAGYDSELCEAEAAESDDPQAIAEKALGIDFIVLESEDEDGNTHVLMVGGEAIGAATAYTTGVSVSPQREIHAIDIESIDTAKINYRPAYLALLAGLIASDPQLKEINGPPDDELAPVYIAPSLPPGWFCEYRLVGERGLEIPTFDPGDVYDHVNSGGRVKHAFKRMQSV